MNQDRRWRVTFLAACLGLTAYAPPGLAVDPPAAPKPPATAPAGPRKITIDEFDRMRREKDAVVLDVRTPKEFAEGHVAGAINIPVSGPGSTDFGAKAAALDKGKTYLVHCARGGRSAVAVQKLEQLGFPRLNDFSGGMDQWKKENKPVEKGEEKPATNGGARVEGEK